MSSSPGPGSTRGFVSDGGAVTEFDVPGVDLTLPSGINNQGQIVGTSFFPPRGFLLTLEGQ